jgi:hypothetical protein
VTNYPEKSRSEDPKSHPWDPITSKKKALFKYTNREAINHGGMVRRTHSSTLWILHP